MLTYSTDMEAAPRDGKRIVVLVPTGDVDAPLSEELAYWDDVGGQFEGEWRHIDELAINDPIAWLGLPDIPDEIYSLVERRAA